MTTTPDITALRERAISLRHRIASLELRLVACINRAGSESIRVNLETAIEDLEDEYITTINLINQHN